MKYKVGDVVQIKAGLSNRPAKDQENLWEITGISGHDCAIRNMYDEYRANSVCRHAHSQAFDTSLILPWKGKLPIQFR